LLPNTNLTGAIYIAELIRKSVEATEISSIDDGAAKKVTISIGISTKIPEPKSKIEDLISEADSALYKAKETGRNRVCFTA
jgi:diguanylate cyclase (GGDEF)-like protein